MLLISLMVVLGAIALVADGQAGRLQTPGASLTYPLGAGLGLSALAGWWVVPWLRAIKAGQFIREDGPQAHLQKAGTPTMGGIFFVPGSVLVAMVWTGWSLEAVAAGALTLAYGCIGWLDDWQVLRRRSNQGISPRMKLALQIGGAGLFCLGVGLSPLPDLTQVSFPGGWVLPLGVLFWPLAGFVMVAESNATNLTDGIDGLAGGTVAIALLGLGCLTGANHPDLMVFCACLSGGCLGFLVHNHHPAKVFMGDTGSLALGGALAAVALLGDQLFSLLLLGGIFLGETLSVLAQVSYYKATKGPDGVGKRLFRMAPFHHHLELGGWSETQVVGSFYLLGAALLGLVLSLS